MTTWGQADQEARDLVAAGLTLPPSVAAELVRLRARVRELEAQQATWEQARWAEPEWRFDDPLDLCTDMRIAIMHEDGNIGGGVVLGEHDDSGGPMRLYLDDDMRATEWGASWLWMRVPSRDEHFRAVNEGAAKPRREEG